jgi:hypothetical protein
MILALGLDVATQMTVWVDKVGLIPSLGLVKSTGPEGPVNQALFLCQLGEMSNGR